MDQRTADKRFRDIKAEDKRREKFRAAERWERSPKVDFPLLALTNSDRQFIIKHLSRGPMSTKELLAAIPFISQRLMSEHLVYLTEAGLVTFQRVPKSATKIWALDEGLLLDLIDTVMRLHAPRYERKQARLAAKEAKTV